MSLAARARSMAARLRKHKASLQPKLNMLKECFLEQRRMIADPAKCVSVCCSRRAGKTEGISKLIVREADKHPVLYFTTTRKEAKRIIWQRLKDEVRHCGLESRYEFREAELIVRVDGIDRIYLTGCNNETEIGKMRGSGWGLVVGDESQLFPAYIEGLVEQTLVPATADYDGRIFLLGTPGPVPLGYFYSTTLAGSSSWSRHHWNATKNPHLKKPWKQLLKETLKRRGITQEHPSIQREFFGVWAYDGQALVFSRPVVYLELPKLTDFVIGVDLGFDDADAICVLGWSSKSPTLYLVHEDVLAKQSISQLGEKIQALYERYSPLAIVADTGALGKKITDEIRRRTGLPIEAADKVRKLEHIELLNDALRTSRFVARADSRFASDAMKVEWDKTNPEKPKIKSGFHSDIADAVLYAYRKALHWLHEPPADPPPAAGTPAWQKAQEEEMFARQQQRMLEQQEAQDDSRDWLP